MKKIKLFCLGLMITAGLAANLSAQNQPTNSTEAILQHPGFREGLVWLGTTEPSEAESAKLWQIVQNLDKAGWPSDVEQFLSEHPNSPWAASLHYDYASFCHLTGRTTKALAHWEAAWELVKTDTNSAAIRLGGEILGNWTEQLSSLGRQDKLRELIPVGDHWPFVNRQDREKFQAAKNNYHLMSKHPEMSFRCGTFALKAVGQMLQPTNAALQNLVDVYSPNNGFTMSGLADLAKQYGLDLVAVRRTQGNSLIVPSVIHWRQNHYAAILDKNGDSYLVNDPTFGKPRWMQEDAINEEASGVFLIPTSAQTSDWQTLGPVELASVHGKGLPNNINDAKDKGCTTGAGGAKDCNCKGMPTWWVSEPYNNLWIADEPISYLTSTGEPFTFHISFKQRGLGSDYPFGIPFVLYTNGTFNPWTHSWSSYIALVTTGIGGAFPTLANSSATLVLPNGGEVDFAPGQSYDPETRIGLQQVDPNLSLSTEWGFHGSVSPDNGDTGLRVIHPDGSQDIYGYGLSTFLPSQFYQSQAIYMLSRHIDPNGRTTQFFYGGSSQMLQYVVDPDGLTNSLGYTFKNNGTVAGYVLSSVTNAYGLTANFKYDGNLNLTNIVDAAGLSSSITYDTNGDPTSLITPYGTTTFALYENSSVTSTNDTEGNFGGDDLVDRAELVTDPIGGKHLYLYRYDCSQFMATNYASSDVPTNTPLGTLDTGTGGTNFLSAVCYRNSFSWDARQYAALSTTNFTSLTANDFLRGTMKHWLQDTNDLTLAGYLSVQRDASPDGTTEGLKTFYDYQGKTYPHRAGTNPVPSVTAWRLPGGETHYEYLQYDYFGNVTNRISTYTTTSGALGTRTNQYVFGNNVYTNVVYAEYFDENGENGFFLPFSTNTFTVPNLLKRVVEPNGSNVWSYGGFDAAVLFTNYYIIGFEQSNQIVLSALRVLPDYTTNGLGQVTTRTYTNFNLTASVQWPDGLTRSNVYNAGGYLVQTVDQQIHRTNSFAYTTNGLISSYTNELGLAVNFSWDNLLRATNIAFPDSTTISLVYSNLDIAARKDRLGNWTHYVYDGLRHLTSVTNANQAATSFGWCDCGALTSITDALTNTTTLNYDYQSRLTNALFPDSSSLNYQYDLAGRRTNVVDSANKSVQLTYNNQGLVTNISNSYGAISQAVFDILDRPIKLTDANGVAVTNAYDMLDRVVSRVWIADGIGESFLYATNGLIAYTNRNSQVTRYGRDAAERLTSLTNANLEVTQFAYDPASHLTNLIDGLTHSTHWNYNPNGWVTNQVDATNRQILVYSYDANGRVTNRFMLASGNTGYAYDAVGNLTNIVYSNAPTHSISYAFDALNRMTNMIDGVGTTAFTFTKAGQLASESDPFSILSGTVSFLYSQGHRTNLTLTQPSGGSWTQGYSYDNAWRLTGLSSPAGSFNYAYPASASELVQSLALPNAANITYQYDSLARLTNTSLANYWGHVLDGYGYGYDYLGQRTSVTRNLGLTTNSVTVGYDNIGQVVAWTAAESGGAARLNEQVGYGYDAANNLHVRTNGALVQTFSVDTLNQISTVARTGTLTLSGATAAPATNVTVNGQTAPTYGDFTFARTNLSLVDGANTFTNIAQNAYGVAVTNSFTANLPATVTMQYDANGNLTNDGTKTFVYDAENELTNVSVPGLWKTEHVFDGLRRKRITRDYTWNGSGWLKTNETRYLYDWMVVIQERDTNNNPLVTYTRGLDISGSRQGAGGIGGLLARTDANGSAYYHSDAAGNITAMMDGNQNIVARYEYDAYGKLIGKWGTLADANVYRFSSKEYQANSGLYCYGLRFYEPNYQRWLNRDPIHEHGGINLYAYVANNPVNYIDPEGTQLEFFFGTTEYAGEPVGEAADPVPVGVPPPRVPDVSYPKNGPFPPEGSVENPFRPGSFGRVKPETGKFQECWRYDKGDPSKPGWQGLDHFHYWGGPEHMTQPPPFQWFSIPTITNPVNGPPASVPVPPGTQVPPGLIPAPAPPPVQHYYYRAQSMPMA